MMLALQTFFDAGHGKMSGINTFLLYGSPSVMDMKMTRGASYKTDRGFIPLSVFSSFSFIPL